jgi:hypothetical protein
MTKNKEPKPAYKNDYLYKAYVGKEYLWLFFSIVSVVIAIYQLIAGTREEAIYFVALTFLAGLFYSFNRFRRKKFEKRAEEAEQKK